MKPKRLKAKCYQHPHKDAVRKIRTDVRFSAAVCAIAGYCAAIPPSRSSLHRAISHSCCTLIQPPAR
jgi:hypothetical protein